MTKLLFPRLKLSKPPKSRFFTLEDLANSGPKYLLMKSDLIDLKGQIENCLGNFVRGGKEK